MHICNKKQYHPISTWVVHKKYKNKKHPVHGYKLQTIKESLSNRNSETSFSNHKK